MADERSTTSDEPAFERHARRLRELAACGEVGRLIARMNWAETPLQALDAWPNALERLTRVCLEARQPWLLAWGHARTQIYNDAFASLCGEMHPQGLGSDFRQCWEAAWPVWGRAFEAAERGEASYLEDCRLLLVHRGEPVEAFLTCSFSPLRGDQDELAGVLLTVSDNTQKVLRERRTRLLAELVAASAGATSAREALELSMRVLEGAAYELTFALVYGATAGDSEGELLAATRSAPVTSALAWPLAQVVSTRALLRHADAWVVPIILAGSEAPYAVLVAGSSKRNQLDDEPAKFYEQIAAALGTGVASARAHEEQRRRAEQLSALDRAKTAFFSNVSHELRTPLTLMAGPLEDELAEREQPLPAARRERLATAHRNTLRLIKMVSVLLDFSRIEAGRAMARYQPTQLGTLTSELASMFRSAIERVGLTLSIEIDPLPEPVFVDRDMWEKIVLNLMSNAFKHTFEGGISVRLRALPSSVELDVTDSGIGIAEQELSRLFERFHRVLGARSRTHEGTGIGLPLVQELSRLHGGDVRVTSRVDHGSTFTITIPRGSAHLAPDHVDLNEAAALAGAGVAAYVQEALQWSTSEAEIARARAASADAPDRGARRPKILIADDNADMRAYVTGLLEKDYRVAAVPDGQAALELIPDFQPDLLLSDVMMPQLDGVALLHAVRENPSTRQLPIVLLSARAGDESVSDGVGADDYLIKPFSAKELLARVRTHVALGRARRERVEQLEQSNRELEAFSYSVSHDLRTPLRAIDGFSKAVLVHKGNQLDEESKQLLGRVRRATARMSELIDELLNLSRVSRSPLKQQPVSLSALAFEVGRALAEEEPARRVSLDIEPDVRAYADARLLRIALENLLKNCWKFTSRRSDALVRVGRVAGSEPPIYFVMDNGAGFNQTYAHRLFQPFQRLHSEREFAGTGIGLAIVHRIVTRHGGRIWAEGRENEGATFNFTLSGDT